MVIQGLISWKELAVWNFGFCPLAVTVLYRVATESFHQINVHLFALFSSLFLFAVSNSRALLFCQLERQPFPVWITHPCFLLWDRKHGEYFNHGYIHLYLCKLGLKCCTRLLQCVFNTVCEFRRVKPWISCHHEPAMNHGDALLISVTNTHNKTQAVARGNNTAIRVCIKSHRALEDFFDGFLAARFLAATLKPWWTTMHWLIKMLLFYFHF